MGLIRLIVAFLLGLSLVACSPSGKPNHSPKAESPVPGNSGAGEGTIGGIVGGQIPMPYELAQKYTVAIRNYEDNSLCTGTIVGKRLVVTAAHCLRSAESTTVIFGQDIRDPSDRIRATKISILAGYEQRQSDVNSRVKDLGDVAVIVLNRDIPKTHRVAKIVDKDKMLRDGDRLMLAGYGATSGRDKSATGRLLKTNVNVLISRWGQGEFVLNQAEGSGACFGDSGGPAFYYENAEYHLIGIASRVGNLWLDRCRGFSLYSHAGFYRDFILGAGK